MLRFFSPKKQLKASFLALLKHWNINYFSECMCGLLFITSFIVILTLTLAVFVNHRQYNPDFTFVPRQFIFIS